MLATSTTQGTSHITWNLEAPPPFQLVFSRLIIFLSAILSLSRYNLSLLSDQSHFHQHHRSCSLEEASVCTPGTSDDPHPVVTIVDESP
ncbi:uncharacterized protein EAF01_004334 [Botrytis porri]|uniref:uncharacterized protein n=1 Tax=Botrytis porri TaxID=87229 RepID=UPI0019022586|nr:uncharacterized protein EAF01_004334 [Botrytis porri]KAF7908579.1 hypothetical protein EAF01_004334 [Botrytis porri]